MMVDVGQGDSILLLAPGWNQATLIDTGGLSDFKQKEAWRHRKKKDQGITTVVPALQAEGLSELSQVMLSHGDEDHVGNLKTIAKHITIRQLIIGKGMEKIPLMQEMKRSIQRFSGGWYYQEMCGNGMRRSGRSCGQKDCLMQRTKTRYWR